MVKRNSSDLVIITCQNVSHKTQNWHDTVTQRHFFINLIGNVIHMKDTLSLGNILILHLMDYLHCCSASILWSSSDFLFWLCWGAYPKFSFSTLKDRCCPKKCWSVYSEALMFLSCQGHCCACYAPFLICCNLIDLSQGSSLHGQCV